jgi:cytoskeletal protein RodZ
MSRPKGDQGQVLSSLVAVAAVVAIVAGLLVLFGTRGHDSKADDSTAGTPKPSTHGPSTVGASVPRPTKAPTTAPPSSKPPSTAPTETEPTEPVDPTAPPSSEPSQPVQTTEPPQPPASNPVTIPAAERPAVEIYNNSPRKGMADTVAGRARQAGWTVAGVDNWHGKVVESTVYYPPGMLDAANQLARDLGVPRSKQALDNMKKDRLTVILTSDYSG